MSLRLGDALRLSCGNIIRHKKRSLIVILTISILFGCIMAFNGMMQGVQNTVLAAALQSSNDKVYLEIGYRKTGGDGANDIAEAEDFNQLNEDLLETIRAYGGKNVGKKTIYQVGNFTKEVITAEAVADYLDKALSDVPDGMIPVLVPESGMEEISARIKAEVQDVFYEVGTYPATEKGGPILPGVNSLNLMLSQVSGGGGYAFLIVDDGSGVVEDYIKKQVKMDVQQGKYESADQLWEIWPPEERYIVEFDNYQDAATYYREIYDGKIARVVKTKEGTYELLSLDVFGGIMETNLNFEMLQTMLGVLEMIFVVIAVVVAGVTFMHLIDQDAAVIELYRVMGATAWDVSVVYGLYLLELCLLAAVSCVLITIILVGGVAILNGRNLAGRLKDFYFLQSEPKIMLFGMNEMFVWIVIAIISIAPIVLLLTLKRITRLPGIKNLKEI